MSLFVENPTASNIRINSVDKAPAGFASYFGKNEEISLSDNVKISLSDNVKKYLPYQKILLYGAKKRLTFAVGFCSASSKN